MADAVFPHLKVPTRKALNCLHADIEAVGRPLGRLIGPYPVSKRPERPEPAAHPLCARCPRAEFKYKPNRAAALSHSAA